MLEQNDWLLRDQFGNVLPDGIDARFVAISSEGTQEIPAVVQNGRLRTHLVAPSEPSVLEVHAVIHGMSSEPATLTFGSAIASLQGVAFHTAEGLRVEVTDAVGPSGALVANGTPILIDGIETILQQGDATMLLSPGRVDTEPLIVVALGTELLVDIEDAS